MRNSPPARRGSPGLIGAGAGVGHGGARGNVGRVVAGDVGDQQRHHARRVAQRAQPAALERRQVAPHAVHLGDGGAAGQQRAVDGALVVQRQAGRRSDQQRGAAARDQRDDQVVSAQAGHLGGDALRGGEAGGVGHRVRGLDDLDARARHGVAVAGDDQALERSGPVVFQRARHRRRGLAGADHDSAPARRRGQLRRQAQRRLGGGDGGIEQAAQQGARRGGGRGGGGHGRILRACGAALPRAPMQVSSRA